MEDDYLQFSAINPEYDQNTFSEDGVRLTHHKRRQLQASTGDDELLLWGALTAWMECYFMFVL